MLTMLINSVAVTVIIIVAQRETNHPIDPTFSTL